MNLSQWCVCGGRGGLDVTSMLRYYTFQIDLGFQNLFLTYYVYYVVNLHVA